MAQQHNTLLRTTWTVPAAITLVVGCLLALDIGPAAAGTPSPLGALNPAANDDMGQQTQAQTVMPVTASKVHIQAWLQQPETVAGPRRLNVRLDIADGWHVNAHPASLSFLIPTTIKATADGHELTLQTHYPPGVQSGIRLDGTAIKVYENNTTIRSQLLSPTVEATAAAADVHVVVTAQACSDAGICLRPSVIKTRVGNGQ